MPTLPSTPALDGQVASSHTRQALHVFQLAFAGPTDDPVAYPKCFTVPAGNF